MNRVRNFNFNPWPDPTWLLSARVGFYSSDSSSFDDLCIQADQSLFNKVLHNPDHVLHRLLPPVAHTSHNYCLRPRAHDRSLPERLTHLTDCNFIIRMLFYQVYWLYLMSACFHCLAVAFWQLSNTRICYVMLWTCETNCRQRLYSSISYLSWKPKPFSGLIYRYRLSESVLLL